MEKLKKILLIDRRLAKSSYTLRTLVGFYLIYIDYNIWHGLREPDVVNSALVMAGGVFFAAMSLLCIVSGAYGLYMKEYRENEALAEHADGDETGTEELPVSEDRPEPGQKELLSQEEEKADGGAR